MGTAQRSSKFIDLFFCLEAIVSFALQTDKELNYVLRDDIAVSQPQGHQAVSHAASMSHSRKQPGTQGGLAVAEGGGVPQCHCPGSHKESTHIVHTSLAFMFLLV